ncbi:MAG: endolytic transglycosylase MltG [Candidatus Hydrogenedentes bacterium]|nr:endolytic transglycosylase MltG [Candidatus Hydrogenedentota bacterium]
MGTEAVEKKSRWGFWRIILKLYVYAAALMVVAALSGGIVAYAVYDHVVSPGIAGPTEEFTVPKGATAREVGGLLAQAGFIENETYFRIALRFDEQRGVIRHGRYDLSRGLSPRELLYRLYEEPNRPLESDRIRITVPEGLTLAQIAELTQDREGFLEAVAHPDWRTRLGIKTDTLEGYLMPNTYFFDKAPAAAELVARMVEQFEKDYAQLLREIPGADQYDRHAVLTIASLVEEEAKAPGERPLVAAVLYNRLEQGMMLQIDSTLQYALGKYGQRMLNEDKEVDSPYNTYKNAGLPPGPISNPGIESIRAALAPAQADYIYFVSNADGKTHTFSSSAEDHNRAVARFRRDIAEQRRTEQ